VLTKLDDTLFHQAPTTFDHAVTSDHRFYDRYWFQAIEPGGATSLVAGMGLYKNTNVLDGYCTIVHDGKQYCLRASRALRPRVDDPSVGPLTIEVVEGLRQLRIAVEPGRYPIACDLMWTGTYDVIEEPPMWRRLDGRVQTQGVRLYQLGRADGWIEIEGVRRDASEWFASRDHSWGVRPGTGGYEPVTGPKREAQAEFLRAFLYFDNRELGGVVDITQGGGGFQRSFGTIQWPTGSGRVPARVIKADLDISYLDGLGPADTISLGFDRASFDVTTSAGDQFRIECEVVSPAWVLKATGYDMGYADGLGLGAYRGTLVEEFETLDVSSPHEVVVLPDRTPYPHPHREHDVTLRIDGVPGEGHLMVWRDFTDDVEAHLWTSDDAPDPAAQ
jgi:hypothetical protein